MTPNKSGKWKDMEAVTNYKEADFIVVFDGFANHPLPAEKTIYIGQHPHVAPGLSPSFRTFEDRECLAAIRLDRHFNTGEWWIKYDYDYLSNLKPMPKSQDLICIMTYQTQNSMYAQRVKYMEHLISQGIDVDLYGRPEASFNSNPILSKKFKGSLGFNTPDGLKGEHTVGKEIIENYKYTLDYDVGKTKNYISERFYDSLLLWCKPLYFGSTNVGDILPEKSFKFIDIDDLSSVGLVKDTLAKESDYEDSLTDIAEARDLLLNKYQTWPYVHEIINNIARYKV
jgi:hypothetical protein